MADLFCKQADLYAETRPTYPAELFQFIASKTPNHDLAWDAGTGNGQAAVSLAGIFKRVIGTDTSKEQLSLAAKLPNIDYHHFPSTVSSGEISSLVKPGTVDLITVAQAIHWFDLPVFYSAANLALRRPHGVLAAWCYTIPKINESVDAVLSKLYGESKHFWDERRKMVDERYGSIEFPWEAVEGADGTEPVEFVSEVMMDLGRLLAYTRTWSAYQIAKGQGVELLTNDMVSHFEAAWGGDVDVVKAVKFPVFLRIGKVRTADVK